MSIYKGLLMLGGYLTHVEHVEDASRSHHPEAPGARPAVGQRVASPRAMPETAPVSGLPVGVAGGCC